MPAFQYECDQAVRADKVGPGARRAWRCRPRFLVMAVLPLFGAACSTIAPTPAEEAALQASSYAGQGGPAGSSVVLSKRTWTLDEGFVVDQLADVLDDDDRPIALEAQYRALELSAPGSVVRWSNPSTKVRGEVVPGPVYAVNMQHCRDFRHTVELKREIRTGRATACRSLDGHWQLLD